VRVKFLRLKKISWKLTIIYSLLFSLVLIFLNAGILYGVKYFLVQQSVNQVEDGIINTEKMIIGAPFEQTSLIDPEILNEAEANSEINIKIADLKGTTLNSSKNFNTDRFSILSHIDSIWTVETNGKHLIIKNVKVLSTGEFKAYLQVAKNMEKEYAFIKLLFVLLAVADFIGVIISVLAGYIISRRILKPIDRITNTAKEISISDFNSRIDVGEADDELTRLAVTFNDMIERLKTSFEKQNRFVSDASHELRTPISVIQGYINLIDRWGKNDKNILQESIDAIKNETSNMGELTEKLLFLARGDISKLKLHKEDFILNELVEEIFKESSLIAPSHQLNCEIHEKINLYADRKMIKQMFRALIDNSIKFTPIGGRISVHADVLPLHVRIVVSDTGSGIPEDEINNIFNRFYRVDKARTKEAGGSGLGLSIVKWIVDAHAGNISVESEVGKGTGIIILFPQKYDKPNFPNK
jgi:two-component system, OmpR family, sensor histidine kinase ArlS